MADTPTKSDSTVAAREQLEQTGASDPGLEQRAKDQERQQREELGSKLTGSAAQAASKLQTSEVTAAARAGVQAQTATQGGFMDQASRRSGEDALEGHFVTIDLSNKDVQQAYSDVRLDGHRGDYGVYLEPALRDPDSGIPVTAVVRLRDETHARVVVPYEALTPAGGGGRR